MNKINPDLEPLETIKQDILYMVPLIMTDVYEIVIGKNHRRIFTDDTLPDFVKKVLTMAKASATSVLHDSEMYKYELYVCPVKHMEYIGWQASQSVFIIVMTKEQLDKLKGEE